MSEENQAMQQSWCRGKSDAIQNGARNTVLEMAAILKDNHVPIGNVVEIGPQNGYGLQEWARLADSAVGIEVVPEFHDECLALGLECILGAAEDIDQHVTQKSNFYLRDSAEHLVDRAKAFSGMMELLDRWIFISVPVEPWTPKDKAHFSKFDSLDEVRGLFTGMRCIHEVVREPREPTIGRYLGVWVKD